MRLNNKTALITGGARGIGLATARRFLQEGAKVAIADVEEARGEQAEQELSEYGPVAFYKCDVADQAEVEEVFRRFLEDFSRIDVLINNAGITRDNFVARMEESEWQQVVDVNMTGAYHCIRAVTPAMIEQGSGTIINASSVVGSKGNMGQVNYAATKAGMEGMTRSLAKELGPKGITVNAVAPGFVVTPMTGQMPQKVLDKLTRQIPIDRLGQPADIANAYLFLASGEAAYINGVVLPVDGGIVI